MLGCVLVVVVVCVMAREGSWETDMKREKISVCVCGVCVVWCVCCVLCVCVLCVVCVCVLRVLVFVIVRVPRASNNQVQIHIHGF